jgi:periplasmic protein TonB
MSPATSSPATHRYCAAAPRLSAGAVAAIVGAHVAVLAWLVSLDVLPLSLPATPLMVQMVPLVAPVMPPAALPPRPVEHKPAAQPKPRTQPLILAEQTSSPAILPEAPVVAARTPAPITAAPTIEQAAPPVAAPPMPPRFDADYLQNPPPAYPAQSRRFGEEGKVVLRVFVDPDGRPNQIEVRTHSGSPRLDLAAQEAVWRWKFVPARLGGEAVSAWVLIPIVFNLKG